MTLVEEVIEEVYRAFRRQDGVITDVGTMGDGATLNLDGDFQLGPVAQAAIAATLRALTERLYSEQPFEGEGFYAYDKRIDAAFYVRLFANHHNIPLSEETDT